MRYSRTLLGGLLFNTTLGLATGVHAASKPVNSPVTYQAPYAKKAPRIDGIANDAAWSQAAWRNIDQLTAGVAPTNSDDFSGRYKVVWTKKHLYILAEISDDILIDSHTNPLEHYWDDDALEIFIDENNNGGEHLFTYDAFAYHVSLDNQAVDIGPFLNAADKQANKTNVRLYPHHVTSQWMRSKEAPNKIYWEVKLAAYPDTYKDEYAKKEKPAKPAKLKTGKKIGFMMAYCDSDSPAGRDHFIGDINIKPVNGDKNRGYIDSSVFGVMELVK
ncbi:sugar-binding protein [Marinagarivorans algicola]|uniref:sugar-binding protein n=1 Tax=Marinagarivorans algicola TaxID=1513270 RepID=UPI0037357C51